MADNEGYVGLQKPVDATDEYNAQQFLMRQFLNSHNYVALVRVVAVDTPGGLSLAGTVDVQPMVNQLDGQGNAIPHGVVNNLVYFRMQGGSDAIIMDPKPGDIGVCVFCDRDSSAVQQTRATANPGSQRRSDMADGVYLGGLLNGVPSQYILFAEGGITILSSTSIKLQAPSIELLGETVTIEATDSTTITTPSFTVNGNSQFNGTIGATGTITAPTVNGTTNVLFGGKSGIAHQHSNGGLPTNPSGPPV